MRIAYICADSGVPVFGTKGCSIHVQETIREMRNLGASVELFSNSVEGDRPRDLKEIVVHELPRPRGLGHDRELNAVQNNDQLGSTIQENGPFDLIYERYSLWSFAAMELAKASGIPGILEINAPLIDEQQRYRHLTDREMAEIVARRALGSARYVIAVSQQIADYVVDLGVESERIHVIPNGMSPDRFPDGVAPLFPTTEKTFTVGFLGSLKAWHGLSILVEAFDTIHRTHPHDLRLLVVGDGPERIRIAQDLMTRRLESFSLLPGSIPADQVAGALASMDVAIAPYTEDGTFYFSPLKIFEYMAAGLPVVASNLGQISKIIQHGITGILCPPGDAQALAQAIDRLRFSPDLCNRLGSAAREVVLKNHTWNSVVLQILDLADKVGVV